MLKCVGCGKLTIYTCGAAEGHGGVEGPECDRPFCEVCSEGGVLLCDKCSVIDDDLDDDDDDGFDDLDDDDDDFDDLDGDDDGDDDGTGRTG